MTGTRYRSRTGISEAEYDRRFAEQGGGCAICGAKPKARRLHSDHRHTGDEAVRGLLCFRCNKYLPAVLYLNEPLLAAMRAYLRGHARTDGRSWLEAAGDGDTRKDSGDRA